MTIFFKVFSLLFFIFSNISCFASLPHVVPSFFSDIKTIKPSEIPAYIDQCFANQSKIKPSLRETRGKETEVGDIIQPSPSYIIDFAQAIRNSARHMIQSGHMGWFSEESHASAKAWPSFFYTQTPFTKAAEAEVFARKLIEEVVRKVPLSFYGEVYSGDRILIGVDLIADIPSSVSGIDFIKGYGKLAPAREGYKPKNISKLQEQNTSLVKSFLTKTNIDPALYQAMPIVADKVILRISFRKDPMYRDKIAGKFLKYSGYFIDFLSLYPIISNPETAISQIPMEATKPNSIQQVIELFENGKIDEAISAIFESGGALKPAFHGVFNLTSGTEDMKNVARIRSGLSGNSEDYENRATFLKGLIETLKAKVASVDSVN